MLDAGSFSRVFARGKHLSIKRRRIDELLAWFGERVDPEFAKKGRIGQLYTAPPEGCRVICLDKMGPESVKSFPGSEWVRVESLREAQELDYGRQIRGKSSALLSRRRMTRTYTGGTATNWVEFLEQVDAWTPPDVGRICFGECCSSCKA